MNLTKLAAGAIAGTTIVTWLWTAIGRDLLQRYMRGERPAQFRGGLDADLLDDYGRVFVTAHNAGDDLETSQTAIEAGADAIEIDVIMVGGQLYAAHATPKKLIGAWLFRGPTLEDAWEVARNADAVALDLKDSSRAYLDALVAFLEARSSDQVLLSSRDLDSLIELGERLPGAHIYLSVPDLETFERLTRAEGKASLLDGISMRHVQVEADVVNWLHERGLKLIAWTVNDLERVNELVRMGVDSITSDNLAIIELLGGRQGEPLLRRGMSDGREWNEQRGSATRATALR